MSYQEIARKLNVEASTVMRHSKSKGWNQSETQQLIVDNVLANKWLENLEQKNAMQTQQMQRAVADAVREGLQLFEIGQNMTDVSNALSRIARSKALNIDPQNVTLEEVREIAAITQTVNESSKIPMKIWEVENKTPDTAIQINNTNTSENPAASVLNALNRKYNDT